MPLLPASHQRQRQQADCLAACAAIVLNYLHVPVAYPRLLSLLNIRAFGAPFSNLSHLATPLSIHVVSKEADLDQLRRWLAQGLPPIVAVNTSELAHWSGEDTDHAVVLGIDEAFVYLGDPAFDHSPQIVPADKFELAWQAQDYRCAVLGLDTIED